MTSDGERIPVTLYGTKDRWQIATAELSNVHAERGQPVRLELRGGHSLVVQESFRDIERWLEACR